MPSTAACLALLILAGPAPRNAGDDAMEKRAEAFIARHLETLRPLDKAAAIAWWDANITGKDEDFRRKEEAQNRIDAVLSDPERFRELRAIRDGAKDLTPATRRQIEVLYLQYLEKQVDPALLRQMVELANAIEKTFNVFRPVVDGKELTDNAVRGILKTSTDSAERRKAWEASKEVGARVEADLRKLVKLRNEAAAKLGFRNYHHMALTLAEQDEKELLALFDELDRLTREPFRAAKAEADRVLAARCGIPAADLRPWHYHDPFFQEAPAVFEADPDAAYAGQDLVKLTAAFYEGIGLPIADVLARSDLFEKPGKSPHAFCSDIDREGDVRVLCNVTPSEYWMDTMLHELGHGVYDVYIPRSVPWLLRTASHTLTTEGVAMMFGRLSKNGRWMSAMLGASVDGAVIAKAGEAARRKLRLQLLVFSRWCQVMLHFERGMYSDPDQDLNRLWWNLVELYQMVPRPEGRSAPDYGSKIHIVSAPVYYHNYLMGELFASQVHHTICREVLKGADPGATSYVGEKAVGDFMKTRVFAPGALLPWNELTKAVTGEPLNAKAFAADFRN